MEDMDRFGFPIAGGWPEIDAATMKLVDDRMIEGFRIDLVQMMENAGRSLAILARVRFFTGDASSRRVVVLAGGGGNGGGALTAARRLANWGAEVCVMLAPNAREMAGVPAQQLKILEGMGIEPVDTCAGPVDLVLDGLVGYSLTGAPRGRTAHLIEWANRQTAPILSLDVPSGFDASRGTISDLAIRAAATLTLALPKRGLMAADIEQNVGAVYLADISVPPMLFLNLPVPLDVPRFARGDIVRLLRPAEFAPAAAAGLPRGI